MAAVAAVLGWLALPAWVAAATPTPQSLQARLQRIEDRAAIEQLLMEYGRAVDNRDFAAFAALFTDDGEWKGAQGSYRGPKQIQESMEKIFTAASRRHPERGSNFHLLTNVIINLDADRATASSKFIFYKMNGGKPRGGSGGTVRG